MAVATSILSGSSKKRGGRPSRTRCSKPPDWPDPCSPHYYRRRPLPTHSRALVEDNVPLAVGGIDVGPAGPSSPTTVSADGMLHTPRVVGWRDATVFLLACRDPDSGWQLHAVPALACTTQGTPTLDPGRDVATVHWPLSADTLLAYGVAAEASVSVMADRGRRRVGRAPERSGRSHDHLGRRLRQGAPPVRPTHRKLPSHQEPSGQRPRSNSNFPVRPPIAPHGPSPVRSQRFPTTHRWPRPWRRRQPSWLPE